MFDSALRDPSLLGGSSAERWRTNQRILDLEAELGRTRKELEVLRDTTAQMLTAILTTLNRSNRPVATAALAIQDLAELLDATGVESGQDPITAEIEKMDDDHEVSLAYLDRRFRWLKARAK